MDSNDNTITNNNANNNNYVGGAGIYLRSCRDSSLNNNVVSGNTVAYNYYGIYIRGSSYNYIGAGNIVNENAEQISKMKKVGVLDYILRSAYRNWENPEGMKPDSSQEGKSGEAAQEPATEPDLQPATP